MSPAILEDSYQDIKERKSYIPESYLSSGIEEVGTAPTISPQDVFTYAKSYPPTPIWRMYADTKNFFTPKPISVRVYIEDDLFFAENDNLVVYGTGLSQEEALQDLCLHIIHFFEYYRSISSNKLTGDALRLKGLYQDLLIEE